tara:strand:+ start:108 stop:803 length:696 start_codon:yes stop_codon:yes gene_type:complete
MPKITSPITGVPATGKTLNEDMLLDYNEHSITTSISVLNGFLDNDNLEEDIEIPKNKIRPKSLWNYKAEGLTGNFDFHGQKVFDTSRTAKAYKPLPGASVSFFLPELPKVLVATWTVFGANACEFERDETTERYTKMDFRVNGVRTDGIRYIPSSAHGHNGWDPDDEVYGDPKPFRALRRPHRDRVWSGHYMSGDWSSEIRPGWNDLGIYVYNDDRTARFRVRNMKVIWFY